MNKTEPDFWVLEYVTIAKDSRTGLIVAIGAPSRQRTSSSGPAASSPLPDPAVTTTVFHTACPSSSSA